MGHAGAVISGGRDTAAAKKDALRAPPVSTCPESPAALERLTMIEVLKG